MPASHETLTERQIQDIFCSTFKFDPEAACILRRLRPVFEEHGDILIKRMFEHLFHAHPETQRFFPQPVLVSGRHLSAIADAVCMLIESPDHLAPLLPIIKHISQTHHSIQVKPKHYAWIGYSLVSALEEVVSDSGANVQLRTVLNVYTSMSKFLIELEYRQCASS